MSVDFSHSKEITIDFDFDSATPPATPPTPSSASGFSKHPLLLTPADEEAQYLNNLRRKSIPQWAIALSAQAVKRNRSLFSSRRGLLAALVVACIVVYAYKNMMGGMIEAQEIENMATAR